jgi:rod shape-determining protein MreD
MTVLRVLVVSLCVLTALLLGPTVVARLPLPGSPPDLVLVVVLALALAGGPVVGMLTGFAAGLLADLSSDHQVGRLALAYVVVGYLVGLTAGDDERSVVRPFAAVGAGVAGALVVYAAEGVLLGDPRVRLGTLGTGLASAVPYAVVLVPFVVPPVGLLVRWSEADPGRRPMAVRR